MNKVDNFVMQWSESEGTPRNRQYDNPYGLDMVFTKGPNDTTFR